MKKSVALLALVVLSGCSGTVAALDVDDHDEVPVVLASVDEATDGSQD